MKDPTVNPAEANPAVRKNFSNYIKELPNLRPSEVFARDTGRLIDSILPRNPDHWKNNFMTVYTSASHTYGNALSAVEQYIIDLFPAGLFKSVHTAMGASNRQLRSTPDQLVKKKYPILVSKCRIDYGQDGDRGMAFTLLTDRQSDFKMNWGLGNMQSFMKDRAHAYTVEWFLNKWIMNVDFLLVFSTPNEQINWMNYFLNRAKIQHPFIINRPLEAVIPKPLIDEISHVSGVPVYDGKSVGRFLQYMQSVSEDPITYKMKSGSGNDEFFRYSRAKIDTTISPPEHTEGVRSAQTTRLYEISFTCRCVFNGLGYFFMTSPDIRYKSDKPIFPIEDNTSVVCHYTDDIDYRLINIPPGWSILATPSIQFKDYDDREIDLSSILDESLDRMIQLFLDHGMNPSLFLSVEFRRRSQIIELKQNWRIDWAKRAIIFDEVDLWETYRMLILVDQNYIHNIQKKLWGVN